MHYGWQYGLRLLRTLEGLQHSFLEEVRTFHVAPKFRTLDLTRWCKLVNVVFRATEVEDRGEELVVKARVEDDAVARVLEDTRGDKYNRWSTMQFTWAGRSKYVKVVGLTVTYFACAHMPDLSTTA